MSGSVWDGYQKGKSRKKRSKAIYKITNLVCVFLGMMLIVSLLLFASWYALSQGTGAPQFVSSGRQPASTETLPVEIDAPQRTSPLDNLPTFNGLLATFTGETDKEEITPQGQNRTLIRSSFGSAPPTFVPSAQQRQRWGPRLVVVGDVEYPVGIASRVASDIPGLATEWSIRPWWSPAWVPTTDDCGQGTTSIGGHVSWYEKAGPFANLGTMELGESIGCVSSSGNTYSYTVTHIYTVPYNDTVHYRLPAESEESQILILFACTTELDGLVIVRAERDKR